jgi:hypothetical protein
MDGVAYTTGKDLDQEHKEIHFNTNYINAVPEARQKEEMLGVIVHEMVHCWQHDALGTAPGGLIEGIADWVRLKAGFAPPHWKRRGDCDWDAGYERTGYFLEWLEQAHGVDIVRKINEGMRGCKYESDIFWKDCCGKGVKKLWKEYKDSLGEHENETTKSSESEATSNDDKSEKASDVDQNAERNNETGLDKNSGPANDDNKTPREKSRVPVRPRVS